MHKEISFEHKLNTHLNDRKKDIDNSFKSYPSQKHKLLSVSVNTNNNICVEECIATNRKHVVYRACR